jgi:hypothetical protein
MVVASDKGSAPVMALIRKRLKGRKSCKGREATWQNSKFGFVYSL